MYLDTRTVIIINIFSAALFGIALLAVSQGYLKQIRAISRWGIASLLHSLSWILYSLRGVVPDAVSIILSQALMLTSLAFYYKIIAEFTDKIKRTSWLYYLIAASVAGLAYFLWVVPNTAVRIVIMSVSSTTLLFAGAHVLLSGSEKSPPSHIFTGIVFAFCGSILLFRSAYHLFWDTDPNQNVFLQNTMHSVTFLTSYLTSAIVTFGFLLMGYDRYITQHEEAEDKIVQNEKRLNEAQKLAKVGSWEFDLDTNELTWSEEQYHIFEMEETHSDKLYDLCRAKIHPDDIPQLDEAIRIGREKGEGVVYEHRIVCKDGSLKYLLGIGEVFKGVDGRRNMLRGTVQDITERKKAEQLLKEYEYFFYNSNDLVCIANFEGYFEVINPKFEEILGYSREELLNNKFLEFVHPEDVGATVNEMEKLQTGATTLNFTNRYRKKDGTYLLLEWVSTPDKSNGKIYAIARDVTERKRAEETSRKYAILESKSKEMEQFAYIASHDLREPLLTIKNYVELLAEENVGTLDKDSEEYLVRISRASNRMDELIKGLLDYSRLSKLKELQNVDCNEVLNQVLADLNSLIESSGAKITVMHLPTLMAYPLDFKQLLQNLLMNAIKFRRKDSIPEIQVSAEKLRGAWTFRVSDNGIGIEEADKEKIFGLFQRVHSRNEYPGSGIGLAYCKKIVELHHGNIWVESIPGKGSSFFFTILAS